MPADDEYRRRGERDEDERRTHEEREDLLEVPGQDQQARVSPKVSVD
jgi:hypothetical protein